MTWNGFLTWLASWNEATGFWTAVQGLGTVIAAGAALVALIIARSQLSELIRSNRLLAESNDAMTASNVALTRPYVIVDFEFRPNLQPLGGSTTATIALKIENAGRAPAKNVRLTADKPFGPVKGHRAGEVLEKALEDLNELLRGERVIRSLTHVRPIWYYIDEASDIMGNDDDPPETWTIAATYEDAGGHEFSEEFALELSHWRRALVVTDPLQRIAKNVEGVARAINSK